MTENTAGGGGRSATPVADQDLAERCGPIERIDAVGEISTAPAPISHAALLSTRKALIDRRDETINDAERHRCMILIADIDGLLKSPEDQRLLERFARNVADFERFKSSNLSVGMAIMRRWLETQGYVAVWHLALREGPAWRWLHDAWSGFWYRHYCPYPLASSGGLTAKACIRAGNCNCSNLPQWRWPGLALSGLI